MLLDDLLGRVNALPEAVKAQFAKETLEATAHLKWIPNPGPQTMAYFSKADCLLFGGEPGGGKSQLILGLAFNCHERSLVMRRQYGDLSRLVDDAIKIHGSRDGFNGSPPPKLRISDKQVIDFAAAHRVGDEQGQMGKGRDLLAIDEATHFAESQIRFLMGWNRTETQGQRVRTVLATNPPLTAEGLWVIKMFAPWLDPQYPNPAKDGELRWVISDADGHDLWVNGPDDHREVNGKIHRPTSRSYINSKVSDNPFYAATDYEKNLDAMPEPYRSLLMGGFKTAFKDSENQVIPTAWIKAAQERWTSTPPKIPMCAMGVDASGGGDDPMVIACRHDGWYAPLVKEEGKNIPIERIGKYCAGIVISHRLHGATVVVDMGGGYGGPLYEQLIENIGRDEVKGYKGAEASTQRTKEKKLGFWNLRSQVIWQFREALDPSQERGSPIALPPDPELMADLSAPTFEVLPRGIKVEPKEDVCARLGRSTDKGDAVVMAWFGGAKAITHAKQWHEQGKGRKPMTVNLGRFSKGKR